MLQRIIVGDGPLGSIQTTYPTTPHNRQNFQSPLFVKVSVSRSDPYCLCASHSTLLTSPPRKANRSSVRVLSITSLFVAHHETYSALWARACAHPDSVRRLPTCPSMLSIVAIDQHRANLPSLLTATIMMATFSFPCRKISRFAPGSLTMESV